MENEDLWLAKVRSRLEGYSEPLPAGGWERLEKELCASARPAFAPVPLRSRRRTLWRVVAAAAMLAGLLAGGLWLLRLEAPAAGGSSPVVASVSSSLGRGTLGQAVRKAEAELDEAARTVKAHTSLWFADDDPEADYRLGFAIRDTEQAGSGRQLNV